MYSNKGPGAGKPAPPSKKEVTAIATTTKRKTHTSSEVKARYNAKTYQQYGLKLRKVEDAATIDKFEAEKAKGYTTSEAIKRLIEQ